MAQLIVYLLGLITSAATPIGDKINAALQMVGLGHGAEIPKEYRYLVRPDGKTVAVSAPVEKTDHGLLGNWLHAMASDHPLLTFVLVVALGLYVVYKVRSIQAIWSLRGRNVSS